MLSIISAIAAGILTIIQIVIIFGVRKHSGCCPHDHMETLEPLEPKLNSTLPQDQFVGCCPYEGEDDVHYGPHTVLHLVSVKEDDITQSTGGWSGDGGIFHHFCQPDLSGQGGGAGGGVGTPRYVVWCGLV